MVIKSDEEIALIRATAALQDRAMRAAFDAIKPGMRDIEVTAVAETYTRNAGAEYGLLMGASSPIGQSVMIQPRHLQNRVVKEGDQFVLLVEKAADGTVTRRVVIPVRFVPLTEPAGGRRPS